MFETIKLLYENNEITEEVRDILVAQLVKSTKDDLTKMIKSSVMDFTDPVQNENLVQLLNHYEKIIFTSEGFNESERNKEDLVDGWQQLRATILAVYSK